MKKQERLLKLSIGAFAVMAGSIMLIPLELWIVPGVLFWAGLVLGILSQWMLSQKEKRKDCRWGVFTFFSGKTGRYVDTSLIVLTTVLAMALALDGYSYICYVLITAVLFSFSMHCIVNGRIFAEVVDSKNKENTAESPDKCKKKGGKRSR